MLTRSLHKFCLAFLVADDQYLQRTACDSGILKRLTQIVQNTLKEPVDEWSEEEPEVVSRLKESALIAIASLAMLRDDIRRELIDPGIAPLVQSSMTHPHPAVRYSACQCARALTRSIHVLRTSVMDTGIGASLFGIVKNAEEDRRVRVIALDGLCNLLNDFSPFREVNFTLYWWYQLRMTSEYIKSRRNTRARWHLGHW
jgi:armadillo repeat-containing protein 8